MAQKTISYFGRAMLVACDEHCHKAWGVNNRPRVQLSDDEDDYAFLYGAAIQHAVETRKTN